MPFLLKFDFANQSSVVRSLILAALFAPLLSAQSPVSITFGQAGLSSLKYNGNDFLLYGDLRLDQISFLNANGSSFPGATASTVSVDAVGQTQTRTYSWGKIVAGYTVSGSQLNVTVTVSNSSAQPLQQLWFEALGLRFPSTVTNYDGSNPIIFNTLGQPAVAVLQSATASVAVAADDVTKPLQLGFPYAIDRPANTQFPVDLNTGTVSSYPNSFPVINRSIPAGGSDQYRFSIRFGPSGAPATTLASDVYRNFATAFPSTINWADHRAIGQLILGTSAAGYPTNPRGWFLDQTIDVTTPSGVAAFQARVLAYAASSIAILKQMNAQGMITWDIEGEQFPQPTSYIGDPRVFATLAPEMAAVADQYFQAFRTAGFRVGVCLRPQQLQIAPGAGSAQQIPLANPTQTLLDKAAYAHNRWGATLFYIDSNVNATDPNPTDPAVISALSTAFPDSLFIPEHSNAQYFAYSAPYRELRQGFSSTPAEVRASYPRAITVIYTPDGPISQNFNALVAAVQAGDILMYRSWFADPQNAQVLSIYQAASGTVASVSVSVTPGSASLVPGQSQQFSASVTGSTNSQVVWSVVPSGTGFVSNNGVYTAPATVAAAQTVSVIATSVADSSKSGAATVSLVPPAVVSVIVSPALVSLGSGQTQQFSAGVTGSSNTQVSWTLVPAGVGSISPNGLFTAPANLSAPQSVSVVATSSADTTKSATATVNVSAAPVVTITLSPGTATLGGGQLQQFTASVTGAPNTAVTWTSSPPGVGTISSSGLYSAPPSISVAQNVVVTATTVASPVKSASASITLTAPAAISCGAPATGAFTGCYYSDRGYTQFVFSRTDPQIAFQWNGTGPGGGIGSSQYAVRWQGNFVFAAGPYQFTLATDDGSRLFIDGQLVIDGWGEHAATPVSATVPLSAGTHLIRLDYFQLDGAASASLNWNLVGTAIPVSVSVTPSAGQIAAGQTQQFSASVTGSQNQQVVWSSTPPELGTVSATGLFRAAASVAAQASVTVTAASAANPSKSGSAILLIQPQIVVPPAAISVSVNPQTVNITSGQLQPFSASVTGTANSQVIWTISPPNAGAFSAAGIYNAPLVTSPQTVTVTATSLADGTKSGTAVATISPAPSSCGAPSTNAFTGCYYSERLFDPSVFAFTRVDPQIDFVWSATGPGGNIGLSNYQVRWQGNFTFSGGNYAFTATSDDGSRLSIDGQLVLDYWGEHPAIPLSKVIALSPGAHLIQFDYMQLAGTAVAKLAWVSAP